MPFYRGETLANRLKKNSFIPMRQARRIAVELTRAVAALHRLGIIHRDIKPDNIILTDDGGLRLVDLGVARLPRIEDAPGGDIPGPPRYFGPELFDGKAGNGGHDPVARGGEPEGEGRRVGRERGGRGGI